MQGGVVVIETALLIVILDGLELSHQLAQFFGGNWLGLFAHKKLR